MSTDPATLSSKVLILDNAEEHYSLIKQFCTDNGLIAYRIKPSSILKTLASYADLGAILMDEDYMGSFEQTMGLVKKIRDARPELPIIFRRHPSKLTEEITTHLSGYFIPSYSIDDFRPLRQFIDKYLFTVDYPNAMIQGITDITRQSLESQFKNFTITPQPPYLVKDRIIKGEVSTMIPIESNWCRGYMMLETDAFILDHLVTHSEGLHYIRAPYRDVNHLLGEITNLIWGYFKNRFINDTIERGNRAVIQVPIVTNHSNHYLSFGSESPQLRFNYYLNNPETGMSFSIYQWFIFNLHFTPELFEDMQSTADNQVDTGELELF